MACLERVALSFGHRSRSIWVGCRLKPDGDVYRVFVAFMKLLAVCVVLTFAFLEGI